MSPNANDGRPRLELRPFRGLRYVESAVSSLWNVTSPPVDLLDAGAIQALKYGDQHNIVQLILPRGSRGYLRPHGGTAEYAGVEQRIQRWRQRGVLTRDERPALYVYEYADGERSVRGLIGEIGVHEPADGVVHPHEAVRPEIVADCVDLMVSAQANLEPILAVFDGGGPAGEILGQVSRGSPTVLATSPEGLEHRLWLIDDPQRLSRIAADLAAREALIADGHHRYAAYRRLRRERGDRSAPANRWNFGLAMLVDQQQYPLRLGPIHRSVPGLQLSDLARTPLLLRPMATREAAERALADDVDTSSGELICFLVSDGTEWMLAQLSPAHTINPPAPVATAVLHDAVLPVLVVDESTIGYHHSVEAAVGAATETGGLAFIANPPSAQQVMNAASQGITLPRKTTSFGPKPRIGFVLRLVD